MSEQSYHEKVKRFEQLIREGQQWKDQDVARSLVAFRHAKAIFPTAQGIDEWIAYLEARLKQRAIHTARASQNQLQAAEATASSAKILQSSSATNLPSSSGSTQPTHTANSIGHSSSDLPQLGDDALQRRIKEYVRQAEQAAKEKHISQSLGLLDQACRELEQANGPKKAMLRILDRRNSIVPTAPHLFRSAQILQDMGEPEQALNRMDAALHVDPMYLECLWAKVDLSEQLSNPHQLVSALMQLSEAYEKTGDFKAYDDVQRRAREVRDKINEWSGEFANITSIP